MLVTNIKHYFNIVPSQLLHQGGDMKSTVDLQCH